MDRIIDISRDDQHLRRYRGFLLVEQKGEEIGRVALDEILALIVHAHGITYSHSLLYELANRGSIVVFCAANHFPVGYLVSSDGHYLQAARTRAQLSASLPRKKQLWKEIVVAKIQMQAAILEAWGKNASQLQLLSKRVRSGDPDNLEAQAARIYWPSLFGQEFRRDRQAEGANALLNYGYTVLRAVVARAIVAAGFIPAVSLHHHNQLNSFALADDLIEPYRPIIDACVFGMVQNGIDGVNPESKQCLTKLIAFDLQSEDRRSPLTTSVENLCFSLGECFENSHSRLKLPCAPTAIELRGLGEIHVQA